MNLEQRSCAEAQPSFSMKVCTDDPCLNRTYSGLPCAHPVCHHGIGGMELNIEDKVYQRTKRDDGVWYWREIIP